MASALGVCPQQLPPLEDVSVRFRFSCAVIVLPFVLCRCRMGQAFSGSRAGAGPAGAGALVSSARALKVRRRRLLVTTHPDARANAAPASLGHSRRNEGGGLATEWVDIDEDTLDRRP